MNLVAREQVEGKITKGVVYQGAPVLIQCGQNEEGKTIFGAYMYIFHDGKAWDVFTADMFMPLEEIGP